MNALVKCASVLPGKKDEKYVALTFDEGPSNQTEEIIRILQEKGVKATFFVSGDKVASNSAAVRAIAESGNEIGTNAYSDVDLRELGASDLRDQITKGFERSRTPLGHRPRCCARHLANSPRRIGLRRWIW